MKFAQKKKKKEKSSKAYGRADSWAGDLACFHTRAKCAIRMIIQVTVIPMTVFWPVCTEISITKANLNYTIQILRCFPVTHLSNQAAKSPYECLDLYIVIFLGGGGGVELRDPLTTSLINRTFSNRNSISNEIAISMSEEHRNEPRFFSLPWNALCTLSNSNIANSQLQFVIAILNLLSCENSPCSWPVMQSIEL